jgi:hypothetical protein
VFGEAELERRPLWGLGPLDFGQGFEGETVGNPKNSNIYSFLRLAFGSWGGCCWSGRTRAKRQLVARKSSFCGESPAVFIHLQREKFD